MLLAVTMAEEMPVLEEVQDLGNPVPIILGVIGTIVVAFFAGRRAVWLYGPHTSRVTEQVVITGNSTVGGKEQLACAVSRLGAAAAP